MTEPQMQPGTQPPAQQPAPARRVSRATWWGVASVVASVVAVGLAYQALRSEMTTQYNATKDELSAIHSELREIRQAIDSDDADDDSPRGSADNQAPTAALVRFNVSGYPVLGNPKASLVMVEFTDFQCPYCARYQSTTYPALKKAYIDSQRMRYVTVDFPLDFHEYAFKAAEAAHCGDQQGQYWAIHDKLFQATPRIDPPNLLKLAESAGLNGASFKSCLESGAMESKVRQGIAQAEQLGIDGTPTFIIGRAEGSVVRGRLVVGAYPTKVFDDLIRNHLALK